MESDSCLLIRLVAAIICHKRAYNTVNKIPPCHHVFDETRIVTPSPHSRPECCLLFCYCFCFCFCFKTSPTLDLKSADSVMMRFRPRFCSSPHPSKCIPLSRALHSAHSFIFIFRRLHWRAKGSTE